MNETPENCENCGEKIGRLETPYVWQGKIVCGRCHARLSENPLPPALSAPPVPILPYAGPAAPVSEQIDVVRVAGVVKALVRCPKCQLQTSSEALQCTHCGQAIPDALRQEAQSLIRAYIAGGPVLNRGDLQIVCPHCQTRGAVRTRRALRKVGISGSKATAALLTGGLSLPLTGLSRKELGTTARCGNCGAVWNF